MSEFLEHAVLHTLEHFIKLLPFLFLAYLLMEFLEHRAGEKMEHTMKKAGKVGPLFGGLLGAVPQCSFSAAASGLYAGRIITRGTLIAVYLSTSDEMLPVLLASSSIPTAEKPLLILKLLAIKLLFGIAIGFLIDLVMHLTGKDKDEHDHITDLCEAERCHCEKGIWSSALHHTLHISLFILLIMFVLNTAEFFIGEDALRSLFSSLPVVGHLLAGLVGLIPNCAASVVVTELYAEGVISAGCMLSGLFVGAGVGLPVLFRTNRNFKENLIIVALLYGIGVVSGLLLDIVGIGAIL